MPLLPTFSDGDPVSAANLNVLSRALLTAKGVADRPRTPFRALTNDQVYTGYIYHQYNTLSYRNNSAGSITVNYGGTDLGSMLPGNNSYDLSVISPALTAGVVYQVTVTISGGGQCHWLAETYSPTMQQNPVLTEPTAWATSTGYVYGNIVTHNSSYYSCSTDHTSAAATEPGAGVSWATVWDAGGLPAANINRWADNLDEMVSLGQTQVGIFERAEVDQGGHRRNDPSITMYTGYRQHIANRAHVQGYHAATSYRTNSQKSSFTLQINGVDAFRHVALSDTATGYNNAALPNVAITTGRRGVGGGRNQNYAEINGYFDLSGLGLTLGQFYKWELFLGGGGTSKSMDVHGRIEWLAAGADESEAWANPIKWERHGQNLSAANMNLYTTGIERLFPGSGAENMPLYYENPVQFIWPGGTLRTITHSKKFLVYVPDGEGTPEVFVAGVQPYSLKTAAGVQFFDLDKIPYMNYGTRYAVDDVNFALEVDSVSELGL